MKEGIYEEVISKELNSRLYELKDMYIDKDKIDVEEAKTVLSKYVSEVIKRGLSYIRDNKTKTNLNEKEILLKQIKACNEIIDKLSMISNEQSLKEYEISEEAEILTALYSKINSIRSINNKQRPVRPTTSLSQCSLFTGASKEPSLISEFKKEILSCDSIDMLVSFIKWSGIRLIYDELKELTKRNDTKVRIITTSYMGATDFKAILELSKLKNVEIKISYDIKRTRLHAKAYMFKRETGFTTAYIGSSNLSNPAVTSGLEWNMKVTEKDSFDIIKKFGATFESYWNDGEFIGFSGKDENDKEKLRQALKKNNRTDSEVNFMLDITPYYYQKQILEQLQAEREIFSRNKNLIVAATGVGKTVISAFDYKRFVRDNQSKRLLFVAHREEILKQSRDTFRAILKDGNFGDMFVGQNKPSSLDHLFISIQSFNSSKLYDKTTSDYYDFIIVDEFHHAAAPSYKKLLEYYKPKILLGLTATPERMDNKDIQKYFDNKIAAEIRLTEAIDRKLLCPFQYFSVADNVDLSKLKFGRKGYDTNELTNLYTDNHMRSIQIYNSIKKYVTDMNEVKALCFCVSIKHAQYMSNFFNNKGLKSMYLTGQSLPQERKLAKHKLETGEINYICVVDLYNEGIDIPAINTVLFLRPTESLTVFLQQLGRGLRLHEGKECLTVLDFVGQAHKSYNFEEKFQVLLGKTKHSVKYYIENGFINLPKGCHIQLEKQAKEYILNNIKQAINTKAKLISMMQSFETDTEMKLTLENFLNHHHISVVDFYGGTGKRSFYRMIVESGLCECISNVDEELIVKRLKNLFHINSRRFIKYSINLLSDSLVFKNDFNYQEEKLMKNMLYYTFYTKHPAKMNFASIEEGINKLKQNREMKEEIIEILKYNYNNIHFVDKKIDIGYECPLDLHCMYTRDQILAGLGDYNEVQSPTLQAGVKYFKERNIDAFFITLNKSEKDFSPSTLYEDYAINEHLFHWQSQSTTSVNSPTGQRYINHRRLGSKVLLFVREYKNLNNITGPYTYLGTAEYVSHQGNRPISFVWRLNNSMPPEMVKVANKNIL
ncbi:DEAD/DEAH box helicase [Abyssisolibacter fermentans]|uniref:DEAD/DEAH box helicase n=1 Tax=Abyssisolibacter fermentans TaxID=1766203 RepID=UPI0008302768|nr:DEAD/DEAH box helicase [Abyssisolibacter fermentans]